jgi:N-methylhydantoinase A/oxoprolinase/acetone carboxylase beta subunit
MIRIGVDVGGTNTDAVVMDGAKVLAGVKAGTTGDVTSGVVAALKAVLAEAALEPSAIDVVMIGTTHFTNAVVQRRDLAQTAAIRLGLPATASLPPMVDWPDDLKAAIGGHYYMAMEATSSMAAKYRLSTKRSFSASLMTFAPRAFARRRSPRCSVPSTRSARRRRATFCRRRFPMFNLHCLATSAGSGCSSARTPRS